VTWLTESSLWEREGTSKVCYNDKVGDKSTVPAPVTGEMTPLTLAMQVHRG